MMKWQFMTSENWDLLGREVLCWLHSIIKQDRLSLKKWESDWKMKTNAEKDNVYDYKINGYGRLYLVRRTSLEWTCQ